MSLLDYLNPFDKIVDRTADVIDEMVEDKDVANEIKGRVQLAKIAGRTEIERSYQVALQTKTHWFFDGIHKLGRQVTNLLVLYAGHDLLSDLTAAGTPITFDHVLAVAALGGPAALYTVIKGRGKP